VDFGVAKAVGRIQATRDGVVKGKASYMAPEQLRGRATVDRRADVYSASVVLWELLTGKRLFKGDNDFQIADLVLKEGLRKPPSSINAEVPAELDEIVLRGAALKPSERYATAMEMADALERAVPIASPRKIGSIVQELAHAELMRRARQVQDTESGPSEIKSAEISAVSDTTPLSLEETISSDRIQAVDDDIAKPLSTTVSLPRVEKPAESDAVTALVGEEEITNATGDSTENLPQPAASQGVVEPLSTITHVSTWSRSLSDPVRRRIAIGTASAVVSLGIVLVIGRAVVGRTARTDRAHASATVVPALPSEASHPEESAEPAPVVNLENVEDLDAPSASSKPATAAASGKSSSFSAKRQPVSVPPGSSAAKSPDCPEWIPDSRDPTRKHFNPNCLKK
jgi:serine/threonine-protein kinase